MNRDTTLDILDKGLTALGVVITVAVSVFWISILTGLVVHLARFAWSAF